MSVAPKRIHADVPGKRVSAKVIAFPSARQSHQPQRPETVTVTQDRLQEAKRLLEQENEIVRLRRKVLLEILSDLQAGANIEPGELSFDAGLGTILTRRRSC